MRVLLYGFILFCTFILNTQLQAQEIVANVNVNMEMLAQENRVNVQTMESDLENYINNQRFTNIEWEGAKIPVEISIYLAGGAMSTYSARLFVVAKRMLDGPEGSSSVSLKLVDDKWAFEYSRYANLTFNPNRFHEFTSLIDFYMLLVIGMELDSYGELEGSQVFDLAKRICQIGASAGAEGYQTFSEPGKFTRYNLINEITDLRYEPLRKLIFSYYVDGLDLMYADSKTAIENIINVMKDMYEFKKNKMTGPSVFLQAFFDAKNMELSELFKKYPDKSIYDLLIYLDPGSATMYRDAKETGR